MISIISAILCSSSSGLSWFTIVYNSYSSKPNLVNVKLIITVFADISGEKWGFGKLVSIYNLKS